MKYEIEIEKRAFKALKKIPVIDRNKIIKAIENLAIQPRPAYSKKLVGRAGWRIRIGNYRVIYEIEDHVCRILVLDLGHRKEIYL
jgi:mRNA interferase RelE/StbE